MRLATFTDGRSSRIGVVVGDAIVDLSQAAPSLPSEMIAFLEAGAPALDQARRCVSRAPTLPLSQVKLLAPILRPPNFIILGLNYADHAVEAQAFSDAGVQGLSERTDAPLVKPDLPLIVNKQTSCIAGPADPIHLPRLSDQLDYEAELGFVIGRTCRNIPRHRAHEFIAGYLVVDDVSVRDYQLKSPTVTIGKSFDTHGPIGPWIVTGDEIGDPHALDIRCWVNDELRQNSNTRHLISDCFDLVESLSKVFTLLPGTIVATGTPGGVGFAMQPPKFLKVGDVVRVEIEKIGSIRNVVIAEPPIEN